MKIRYLNGEKVYVHDVLKHDTTIYSHRQAIKILNDIFKKATDCPEGCEHKDDRLFFLLHAMTTFMGLKSERIDQYEEEIVFDNDNEKKRKVPRLRIGLKKRDHCGLKVHTGGLYNPSERQTYKADDLISDEFKAWRRAQRTRADHSDNA